MEAGRGPAEEPRDATARGRAALGVPGPREDCRREEEVGGMARWWGFRRRRLDGSVEGERGVTRGFSSEDWGGG